MEGGRATISDVAREAGVSVATVSRALRGMPNVAPETRRRVVATAEVLGYQAHAAASSLASGRTTTLGVVAPYFGIWYTGQVLTGIEQTLADAGYDLAVYAADTPENRERFFSRAPSLQTRIDGLLLVDFSMSRGEARRFEAMGRPVVSIGRRIEGFSSLSIDNQAAAHLAVSHLLSLGHRRIAVVGSEQYEKDRSPVLAARLAGYVDALDEAGVSRRDRIELPGDLSTAGGVRAMERWIRLRRRPTAIVAMSDETAMGAMGRARELGIAVPDDVSVMGFDDHDLAAAFGLSTIRQPVRAAGARGAALLLEHVADPARPADHLVLPVELVARTSTGSPAR